MKTKNNENNTTRVKADCDLPVQASPVKRAITRSSLTHDGVGASDNDHNTDTEHDLFFIKMS